MASESHQALMDVDRLGAWMDRVGLPDAGAPITYSYVSGGSQNEIFEIRRADFHAALRRPPHIAPEGRNEGILREWRIIEALADTDVPHTDAYAVCTDTSVLGCTFYLMGFVDGWSPVGVQGWPPPFDTDPVARAGLAYQLVDGTARLSKVDWKAKGLSDLGRPDGFHERQVERWTRFYDRVKTRDVPGLDVATEWLNTHKPIDFVPGIMHGDYQFANVMYHHGAPARLAAIVDWEMATIGDPLMDLGTSLSYWAQASDPPAYHQLPFGPTARPGMMTRDEVARRYLERSGRTTDNLVFYYAFGLLKTAVIAQQIYYRFVKGLTTDPRFATIGFAVRLLGEQARVSIERSAI
jgi:aminoglycoside phosphotransferase (APT) family kinase protein